MGTFGIGGTRFKAALLGAFALALGIVFMAGASGNAFAEDYGSFQPDLAYDPGNDRYLAVFTEIAFLSEPGYLYGQFLDAMGNKIGGSFPIATGNGSIWNSAVAFDPTNGRYLVVWHEYRNSAYEIFGQLVDVNGNLLDQGTLAVTTDSTVNFPISTPFASGVQQYSPDVAFGNDRFLVAWENRGYGRLITVNKTIGTGAISGKLNRGSYTSVTFDPSTDTFYAAETTFDRLMRFDPATGLETTVGNLVDASLNVYDIQALTINSNTGVLYGVDPTRDDLVAISPATGAVYRIGLAGALLTAGYGNIQSLAFDPNTNTLYGVDATLAQLLTISTTDAAVTLIGALGFTNVTGLAFDPHASTLILYGVDPTADQLITINTSTGAGTMVGTTGVLNTSGFLNVNSLTIDPDPDGVPATADAILYGVDIGYVDYDIVGQMVATDGTLLVVQDAETSLPISIAVTGHYNSAVAFDSTNDRFLVVWDDYRNAISSGADIYGQMVNRLDGSLYDSDAASNFVISEDSTDQNFPAAAFDSTNDRFLVVWEDRRNTASDVYGQLVDPVTLDLLLWWWDSDISEWVLDTGIATDNFRISVDGDGLRDDMLPAVAYAPGRDQFLVTWFDDLNAVLGRYVDVTGQEHTVLWSGSYPSRYMLGYGFDGSITVAGNTQQGNFLAVYAYWDSDQCCEPFGALATAVVGAPYFAPSITVGPLSGSTTERGGQATFTVVLNSQPFAEVGMDLGSTDSTEGTPSPLTLTFTPLNWNAPQTVTVTGVNDDEADGNQLYSIEFTSIYSDDYAYDDANPSFVYPSDVSVTNIDDETAGITVSAASGPTSEGGGQTSFTVVLNSQPGAGVSIAVASGDATEGGVSTPTLSFTSVDWASPKTVNVTGVNDDEADGNQVFQVTLDPSASSDGDYAALTLPDVLVTNIDDETAGIIVGAPSGPVTELLGSAEFSVVLASMPTADVTIAVTSDDEGEVTVSPASLTFTSTTWNTAQQVILTGVEDLLADGNQVTAIKLLASSSDLNYNGMAAPDVLISNFDIDSVFLLAPQLSFPGAALAGVTDGGGGSYTFSVDYTSPAGNAPVIHELWIDANGDGSYNTTTVASVSGVSGHGSPPVAPAVLVAALALLGLLGLVQARRPVGWRGAMTGLGVFLALGVILTTGLSACSGGGGGGGGGTEPEPTPQPSTTPEVYKMTAVPASDGNFANGEPYQVTVTLTNTTNVKYRFVFFDANTPALGLPTVQQTLTP